MTYKEFNEFAFRYYFQKANSPYCTLGVDQEGMNTICQGDSVPVFPCLKTSWTTILTDKDNIPQYFGLIAIQCFASTTMENDSLATLKAYKVRLSRLLDLAEVSELDALFSEAVEQEPIQQLIWKNAQVYIEANWYQQLILPEVKQYAWRYVQFPKSQSLLNKEDLKVFADFFSQHIKKSSQTDFNYFRNQIYRHLGQFSAPRIKGLLQDQLKAEAVYKQLYNFFLDWEGSNVDLISGSVSSSDIEQKFILRLEDGIPKFYLLPYLVEVSGENVLNYQGYKPFHKNIKIFNEYEYGEDEYEDTPCIFEKRPCYILMRNYNPIAIYKSLINNHLEKHPLSSEFTLFKISLDTTVTPNVFNDFSSQNRPLRLIGGLKISNGRTYLKNFGPNVEAENPFNVLINGKLVNYNPFECDAGVYSVRGGLSGSATFTLVNPESLISLIEPKRLGWRLSDYTLNEEYDLEGAYINLTLDEEQTLTSWLRLQVGQRPLVKTRFKNILLRAINNSHV